MRRNIVLLFVLTIILTNTNAQSEKSGCGQSSYANIQEVVERYAADTLFNGSILIAQKNSTLYQGSFGYANIETKEKITSTTLFAIASVTKQFTATAILLLQERGELSIDDNIGDYLNVPSSMQAIPIKNLMNHTSGIPDYWGNNVENNADSILSFHFKNDTLLFPTNTKHYYCNSGYFLLGQLIESVSGGSYSAFLKENIFEPIGMHHTFVYDGDTHQRAIAYDENWEKNDYLINTADGGIISTVDDLFLWNQALTGTKLLSEKSKNLMFTPLTLEGGENVYYGFGWDVDKNNRDIVSHTGWLASFAAYNQHDIKKDYYIILLSNQIRPELLELIDAINRELYEAKSEKK